MYPPLFDRVERDYKYCLDRGLKLIVKSFKGIWEGRSYPASYSEDMRNYLFENFEDDEMPYSFGTRKFLGRRCNAGMSIVQVWESGDVTRCVADTTLLGNVYTGFDLNGTPRPCVVARCPCFDPGRLFDDPGERPDIGPFSDSIARMRQAYHLLRRVWRES
jgi:hypothetical protein